MDQKQIDAYGKIISNAVYGYIATHPKETSSTQADDVVQQCWLKLLNHEKQHGELPDYGYFKKMCHNTVVDWARYEMQRNHDNLEDDPEGDRAEWYKDKKDVQGEVEQQSVFNDLLSMFPEDSKETTYLKYFLEKAGLAEYGFNPPVTVTADGRSRDDSNYTDEFIAKELGFSSTWSGSWKRFHRKMRDILIDYFGEEIVDEKNRKGKRRQSRSTES